MEQVKRNIERFPDDFCFQLDDNEFAIWRSQNATSKSDKKGLRRPPYAFTEAKPLHLAKSHLKISKSMSHHCQKECISSPLAMRR